MHTSRSYPLTDSTMHICKIDLTFQEFIDNDEIMAGEDDGSAEDEFEAIDT